MFYDRFLQLCSDKGVKPSRVAVDTQFNKGSITSWKKKYDLGQDTKPTAEILEKIATYFGVSVDYLLGNTDIKNPPEQSAPEEIAKVALFGGDGEVTEEMWQEVKDYVAYIKQKHFNRGGE